MNDPPAAEAAGSFQRRTPWGLLLVLMAYSFMSWFNRVSMSVAGSEKIIPAGVLREAQMGDVYFILILVYALCMVPGGWLVDRMGPRAALACMGFGSALFVGLTGVVGELFPSGSALFFGLLAVRALMGMCTAPLYPAAGKTVLLYLPIDRLSLANALVTGSASLGIAVVPFAFGTLIDRVGWPSAFQVAGVATAVLAAAWLIVSARWASATRSSAGPPKMQPTVSWPWWRLLQLRSLMLLTVIYGVVGYYEDLFFFWSQHYFRNVLQVGTTTSRTYVAILNVAISLGIFGGGWLADRLCRTVNLRVGRIWLPLAGILVGAAFLAAGLTCSQPEWILVSFALGLAAVGVCEGPIWTTALELGGRQSGTAGAIVNTGGNLGGMLAPALLPRMADALGWTKAIAVTVPICLAGAALLAFVDPREKLEGAEHTP